MCLICDFRGEADDKRYSFERRAGDLAVAIVQLLRHESNTEGHIEDALIARGFTRVELKDLRAPVLIIMAKLTEAGLLDVEPARVH